MSKNRFLPGKHHLVPAVCQGMLAGMSPPVTCAFGPNHSDILRSENSTLFPFHLLHGILSVWTSLSSCHNLRDMIPSWLSSIPSQSIHISFPWSLQSLPPELHTFSSTTCGNIMVSLRKSSPIEVPSSWRNSPGNSTSCSELSWQPPQPITLRKMDRRTGQPGTGTISPSFHQSKTG